MLLLLSLLSPVSLAGDLALYSRTVDIVEDHYLRLEALDAEAAFHEAAEAAEDAIPWLLVDEVGGVATLRQGTDGAAVRVGLVADGASREPSLDDLPGALSRLEDAITGLAGPAGDLRGLPDDLELPVELLIGVSRALDRHSVVLAGSRLENFDERISGKLTGIGARLTTEGGELWVREVFRAGPADLGGLQKNDVILRIDGTSTVGMSTQNAVDRIRGPEDTAVVLLVRRVGADGRTEERSLSLVRAEVEIPNVTWERRPSGVGVIAIDHFSEQTAGLLDDAFEELFGGVAPVTGLVLDLRGNTGGSMIQAFVTADHFLEDGLVVRTEGPNGKPVANLAHMLTARDGDNEPEVPLAVLVDGRSASASEIVAGALLVHRRAVLLGSRTFGKGTVQKSYVLRGGDDPVRLKLTIAQFLLDGGVPVADVGVEPDLTVAVAGFGPNGADLPEGDLNGGVDVVFVDERPGWRDGRAPEERSDVLLSLAEDALSRSAGPERDDLLDALDEAVAEVREAEEARIIETFAARGVDWRAGGSGDQAFAVDLDPFGPLAEAWSGLDVELTREDAPRAGANVLIKAKVRNRSDQDLHRVRVRLSSDDRGTGWSGVVLPVGLLPAGGEAEGTALVTLPVRDRPREELIGVTVEASELAPVALDGPIWLVEGRPPPPLVVSARYVRVQDTGRVELQLTNRGSATLTSLEARFAYPDDERIELTDRDGALASLAPGQTGRVDLGVSIEESVAELPLSLRVTAEVWGEVMRVQLPIPADGATVRVEPPTVALDLPTRASPGALSAALTAHDDASVRQLTAWHDGQKILWVANAGGDLKAPLTLEIAEGPQAVVVEVRDDLDARTVETFYVRGESAEATAEHPADGD